MGRGKDITRYSNVFLILLGILLMLLNSTPVGRGIKYPFSYIFDPIHSLANESGESVLNWSKALLDASSYINDYKDMKEQIAKLKSQEAQIYVDYEEYKSLKQHILNNSENGEYVVGQILKITQTGDALLNKGSKDSLESGDIVSFGRVFLGILTDVNDNSSLIKLPINSSSTYEVIIIPGNIDILKEFRIDEYIKSKGVAIGALDEIRVENMGINSNVSDGDLVLIRDEKVGEILILGTLINVSQNPASTVKNGVVSPLFDYSNIISVYIKKD